MQSRKILSGDEIQQVLTELPGWRGDERGLERTLTFDDFSGAMQFMQACVEGIERLDHHPIWTNTYNRVDIHLDTFDVGHKVTMRDVELARYFDSVLRDRRSGS